MIVYHVLHIFFMGIKYEIATQDIVFLVEKYDVEQLTIKNENIDNLLFKLYID